MTASMDGKLVTGKPAYLIDDLLWDHIPQHKSSQPRKVVMPWDERVDRMFYQYKYSTDDAVSWYVQAWINGGADSGPVGPFLSKDAAEDWAESAGWGEAGRLVWSQMIKSEQ